MEAGREATEGTTEEEPAMTATHVTGGTTCLGQTPKPVAERLYHGSPGHHRPVRADPHLDGYLCQLLSHAL